LAYIWCLNDQERLIKYRLINYHMLLTLLINNNDVNSEMGYII